jgi:hypothetical protein
MLISALSLQRKKTNKDLVLLDDFLFHKQWNSSPVGDTHNLNYNLLACYPRQGFPKYVSQTRRGPLGYLIRFAKLQKILNIFI